MHVKGAIEVGNQSNQYRLTIVVTFESTNPYMLQVDC